MKKNKLSEHYKYVLLVGLAFITYIFILINFSDIRASLSNFSNVFTPFILGFVIAYLLNPLIEFIKSFSLRFFKRKCYNGIAMFLAYLFVGILSSFLVINILPQIIASIKVIILEIPKSIELFNKWLESDGNKYVTELTNNKFSIKDLIDVLMANIMPLFSNLTTNFETIFSTTSSIISFIFNMLLSVLISIYMLMHKNVYKGQVCKAIFAFLSDEHATKFLSFWSDVNKTFSRFINARIVDSTIIGILCWIGCLVLGFENPLLISFIVGVTNVIPYFGPFIGAIPCALIVLLQSPMDMLIFCIFILILQQFDGNILGPKLLGDSLGLTSFWIIFSVAIMTGIFGIVGMFIGVPLFAIIYMLVKDYIYDRLNKKGKSTKTSDYIDNNAILSYNKNDIIPDTFEPTSTERDKNSI